MHGFSRLRTSHRALLLDSLLKYCSAAGYTLEHTMLPDVMAGMQVVCCEL
jgi:hypothetical protein